MKLKEKEILLKGKWIFDGSSMSGDEICNRIEWLISNYLIEIGTDISGWKKLYQDPEDKRYWELTYPESELQGGGAPILKHLLMIDVEKEYKI